MEEFGQEYIQIYCNDVLDGSLALIKTALCSKKNIEFCVHNQEQFINLQVIIDDIFNNFIYYYYAYGDNYSEHPCYNMEFDDCAEVDTPPYLPNCYRKEAKSYYTSLLASENIEIHNDTTKDITLVMHALNHSSVSVTMRYIGLTQESVDNAFNGLNL